MDVNRCNHKAALHSLESRGGDRAPTEWEVCTGAQGPFFVNEKSDSKKEVVNMYDDLTTDTQFEQDEAWNNGDIAC